MLGAGPRQPRRQRQFLITDDSHQCAVLGHRQPEIGKARQGIRQQCRQHHTAETQGWRHAEGPRRLDLTVRHGKNGTAQHLGHIGALYETENGDGGHEPVHLQRRQPHQQQQPVQTIRAGIIKPDDENEFGNGADRRGVEIEQQAKRPVVRELAEGTGKPDDDADEISTGGNGKC